MQKLTGLIAAPFTPFGSDGELNLSIVEQLYQLFLANNVRGALVGGTTGEAASLTTEERLMLTERWCEVAGKNPDFPVVVHVGHSCLKDSQILARHAEENCAHSIAALPPYYFKPTSIEVLIKHLREIAAAAPGLPFYYYHIPSFTGVVFPVIEILKRLDDQIPNFAGVKFTFEDLLDFGLCLEFQNRRFDVLGGRDEILLAKLALGARGAVGSTYNYIAPVFHQVIAAFERGDFAAAQAAQEQARQIIATMIRFGGLPAGKAMMRMIGVDCGQMRLPIAELSNETYKAFETALEQQTSFPEVRSRLV